MTTEEKWTPRVGDRVRTIANGCGVVVDLASWDSAPKFFSRVVIDGMRVPQTFATWSLVPDTPRPIAYVKQTRPDVPYDLRTPYQQRGWAL
jgi:hypothetical protein